MENGVAELEVPVVLMPGILADPPTRHAPNVPLALPYRPAPVAARSRLDPAVVDLLHRFINFPYGDPQQVLCDCGCGVNRDVNTIIANLCNAMLESSNWDYAGYKRTYDEIIGLIHQSGRVPYLAENGFVTYARQTGVTYYAWAIMDDQAALQTFDVLNSVVARYNLPPVSTIISIGAGNGYVEHVFLRQAQQGGQDLQMIAYDTYPSSLPYVPILPGTPLNILTDFATTADCALLLCWPPLGTSLADGSYNPNADPSRPTNTMASDSLRNFELKGGRFLIYIGERTLFACTGDPKFHEMLAEGRWVLVNEDPRGNSTITMQKWCPQPHAIPTDFSGIEHQIGGVSGNDNIWVYFLPPEHTPLDFLPIPHRSTPGADYT
eukprot:GGOE01001191.1.p1 GENE.GGOE01001191.1~~GGOE01001191.1.p1  ORF type:complete len:403 (-),score=87.39 GGOE01001191.1:244-1380(-)